jgi:ferredoxin-NADP reductase
VQWDVSRNPERANPAVLAEQQPVRIGESSQGGVSRSMLVESTELIAQDVLRVRLKAPDGRDLPRWTPGSHIDLHCGDTGISRQYSLCGDPQQADTYEIAVLREEHSRGGSAWVHGALQAGMKVQMRGPRNHFKLDEGAQQLILVAGGIGITPVAAMARAQALGIPYEIHYSCSQRERMALLDALQARHGERLQIYVGAEGRRADYQALLAQVRPGAQIYACGPQRMLDGLAEASRTGPRTACAWSISPAPWEPSTRTRSTALKSSCANPASRCRCATMRPCSMRCAAPISISSATAAKACAAPARCRCSKAISIIATWC